MVTTVLVAGQFALAVGGASKFSRKDDEGVVEHAPLFEVFDKTSTGLVDIVGLATDFAG